MSCDAESYAEEKPESELRISFVFEVNILYMHCIYTVARLYTICSLQGGPKK